MKRVSYLLKTISFNLLGICFLLFSVAQGYAGDFKNQIEWKKIASLPPNSEQTIQKGLASPFAGNYYDLVIVAGGCNFPDVPAAEGGAKKYYSDIFMLKNEKWRLYFSLGMKNNKK